MNLLLTTFESFENLNDASGYIEIFSITNAVYRIL